MAEARIARKDFLKGLGAVAAACVAAPHSAVAAIRPDAAVGAGESGAKAEVVTTASLPYKVRPAARTVARPGIRV